MILVGPCPDEVAVGHVARVGTLNRVTSRSEGRTQSSPRYPMTPQ